MESEPHDPVSEQGFDPDRCGMRGVLVCSDFSDASNAAVLEAAEICCASGAELCVLHVDALGKARRSARRTARLEEKLLEAISAARGMGAETTGVLASGDLKAVVLQMIEESEIDLVVVGTRGARGLRRMLFGSTAELLFRSVRCPVMTVGPRAVRPAKTERGGAIVFATNFHEPAVEAAHWAARMANLHAAELRCIHVLPSSVEAEVENTMVVSVMTQALRELTEDGSECERQPVFEVIFGGQVGQAVVEYSRRHDARAIVLGVRREMPFAAHLPPRTEYKVIQEACCPVVTVSYDGAVEGND